MLGMGYRAKRCSHGVLKSMVVVVVVVVAKGLCNLVEEAEEGLEHLRDRAGCLV